MCGAPIARAEQLFFSDRLLGVAEPGSPGPDRLHGGQGHDGVCAVRNGSDAPGGAAESQGEATELFSRSNGKRTRQGTHPPVSQVTSEVARLIEARGPRLRRDGGPETGDR
jgi:hypothetical protein